MSKFKPCPFCGSNNIASRCDNHSGDNIFCQDCFAEGPAIIFPEHDAIELWNNRSQQQLQPNQSLVNWITYDGSDLTSPLLHHNILKIFSGRTVIISLSRHSLCIGDKWAYLPTPPEVQCE